MQNLCQNTRSLAPTISQPALASSLLGLHLLLVSNLASAALPDNGWIYDIQNVGSNYCVQAEAAPGTPIAYAVQVFCNGSNNQRWQLMRNADGASYRLISQSAGNTNRCLGVADAAQTNGSLITRETCGANGQNWRLLETANGYQFQAVHSNKCMVISGGSTTEGASLIQYDCVGGANEKFVMKKFRHSSHDTQSAGQWGAVTPFGLVPAAAAVLPNGKLLYWSASQTHAFHTGGNKTQTGLLDLATGQYDELEVDTGQEMFCPATAMTADGRIMVAGGGGTALQRAVVNSYDYKTNSWTRESSLSVPRWYSTGVTLGDGSIFTVGGDGAGDAKWSNMERYGDLWNPSLSADQSWQRLTGITESANPQVVPGNDYGLARAQYYRKLVAAPDGRILEIAPNPNMRWHDVTADNGNGASSPAGTRANEGFAQGVLTAQYAMDKILLAGGSVAFGDEDPTKVEANYPASPRTYAIDLNSGQASKVADMRFGRYQANSVVLPNGKVFAVGGAGRSALFDNKTAIYASEIYDPVSQTWEDMAPMTVPRMYHSVALLLPDARVWVAGGGLCGNACQVNHADAEIFSPPYLFKGERPAISQADANVNYAGTFSVTASSNVTRFTLVRLASVTHSTNTDQRLVEVKIAKNENGVFTLDAPLNGKLAPPGYYMLFALNAAGVPSVAKILRVGN